MDTDQPSKAIYDCFVLSGGGSKGAYGAGAAKAVEEYRKLRGLTNPVCYIGASAGALNAYILAAGDADALIDFWLTTTNKAILGVPNGNSKIHAALRYFQQCFSYSPRSLYSNKAINKLLKERAISLCVHGALS